MLNKKDLRILLIFVVIACAAAAAAYWLTGPARPESTSEPATVLLTQASPISPSGTLAPASPPDTLQTQVASGVAATLTALPTAAPPQPTRTSAPTPAADTPLPPPTNTPIPTPAPVPVFTPIPSNYVLVQEQAISAYTFQLWASTGADSFEWDRIATLSADGRILAQHEYVYEIGNPLGVDITGEGNPDVIIQVFTGGAHCCFSTIVYDLGPNLTKVLETPLSNCQGQFQDLDGDGVLEFLTCDDLFAYVYCSFAETPMVDVVLQYQAGRGYVPASPRFPQIYWAQLPQHLQLAESAVEVAGDGMGTAECLVLWPVLDYLYMGDPAQAWAELDRTYPYADKTLFWADIVHAVSSSSLYTPGGPLPNVPQPDYYMLQLLTNCGPDWQFIGFLQEGQRACDPGVLTRGVPWLSIELERLGLLAGDEFLEVAPQGCTTDCRLDIVRLTDGKPLGSIRLDTTVGFPGEVYRTNGHESRHYRLRGDLTWEMVP